MNRFLAVLGAAMLLLAADRACPAAETAKRTTRPDMIDTVLRETKPLPYPRGRRLPLIVWKVMDIAGKDDAETERTLRALNDRGICAISTWNHEPRAKPAAMADALRVAALQHKLGIEVVVFANPLLHRFFNGDPSTAHVSDDGAAFFDDSFGKSIKMGCPFALKPRYADIRARVEEYVQAYRKAGLPLDLVLADWEVDGPIEWNGAWDASRRCRRCRENIRNIEDFTEFQKSLRTIRADMQRACYAEPILTAWPKALVGNYAVYPHDGWRYWYDYFEQEPTTGMAFRTDQRAKYRQWFHEFPLTGFTYANPTVYTWYRTYDWYDFKSPDYRWFYNLLLVATNACKHTPRETPVIAFVHWHTTAPPKDAKPVPQFSEAKYQELLWHMLLRGADTFALWCTTPELEKEIRLVHEVYAASLKYRDFLDRGEPISFDVPAAEGPVVSGLRLGDEVMVIRSDFTEDRRPVRVKAGDVELLVPWRDGKVQFLATRK